MLRGRIIRLGVDETIESFARQNAPRGVLPTTFELESASLHYLPIEARSRPMPVTQASAALHVWSLRDDAPAVPMTPGSALALARSLGLTVVGDHVAAVSRQRGDSAWSKFNLLAYLGANPDWVSADSNFVGVAAALLPEAQRVAFFGQRSSAVGGVSRYGAGQIITSGGSYGNVFQDEFARRDAKRAFTESYWPAIAARIPTWPIPVVTTMSARLGTYDFESQSFPLTYEGQPNASGVFRVAQLPFERQARNWGGIYSAERFGNLPDRIEIPEADAQALRTSTQAQGGTITLAWWSDLDWGTDLRGVEALHLGGGGSRPPSWDWDAQARCAFRRRGLDPAAHGTCAEGPADRAARSGCRTRRGADHRYRGSARLAGETQRHGGPPRAMVSLSEDPEMLTNLALAQPTVRQANEFDRAGAIAAAKLAIEGSVGQPVWTSGRFELGTYDLEAQTFDLAGTDGAGMTWQMRGGDSLQIETRLAGPAPFGPVAVPTERAREIVESGDRRAHYWMRIEPIGVVDLREGGRADYRVTARAAEVIVYRPGNMTADRKPILLERRMLQGTEDESSGEEAADRSFEVEDFKTLAEGADATDQPCGRPFLRCVRDLRSGIARS